MLFVQPREVVFGTQKWEDVTAVTVDRVATRMVREWDDTGPHLRFVDVPDRMVTVRVVQQLARGDLSAPTLGVENTLTFVTAPTASDVGRRRVTVTGVVTGVEHALRAGKFGGASGVTATRTITMVATSSAGSVDPVVVTDESRLQ
jgi:hypothetical protein